MGDLDRTCAPFCPPPAYEGQEGACQCASGYSGSISYESRSDGRQVPSGCEPDSDELTRDTMDAQEEKPKGAGGIVVLVLILVIACAFGIYAVWGHGRHHDKMVEILQSWRRGLRTARHGTEKGNQGKRGESEPAQGVALENLPGSGGDVEQPLQKNEEGLNKGLAVESYVLSAAAADPDTQTEEGFPE